MKDIALKSNYFRDMLKELGIDEGAFKPHIRFYLRIYSDEELKMFRRLYDNLTELMETFENPTVGDVSLPRFKGLMQKAKRAIYNYEKDVPEEFKRKFSFDVNKLEEIILSLQEEFIKD